MLLPDDLVVWDKELVYEDSRDVGVYLASLGELSRSKIEILPHLVVTKNAYSLFLKDNALDVKIKHLLGTLNHDRHDSLKQVSENLRHLILRSKIHEDIHKPFHKKVENILNYHLNIRAYYFDNSKIIGITDFNGIKGDSVAVENIRNAWANLYCFENLAKFNVHAHNNDNLSTVISITPVFRFDLTGYVKHIGKSGYEVEAHEMVKYSYNKMTKKIENALTLPGGDKNALTVSEIKELLDIGHISEKILYLPHAVFWGRMRGKIYVTKIVPLSDLSQPKDTFNSLLDVITLHPGITVGKLRVIDPNSNSEIELRDEIIVAKKVDKKLAHAIKEAKGLIVEESPHPEVLEILKRSGIPSVVKKDKLLYSTGDVVSLNATTGEIKRGSMLVS